jgi:tetratricopeptide (TPR) repeat protein
MKNLLVAILFAFLFINSTFACLNGETKFLKDGTFLFFDKEGMVPYGHDFISYNFDRGIIELDKLYKKTKDLDYLSDKAFILILKKKYVEAIKIYEIIERISPNRYATASNLGTAYELMGKNEYTISIIEKERSNSISAGSELKLGIWMDQFGRTDLKRDSIEKHHQNEMAEKRFINEIKSGYSRGVLESENTEDIENLVKLVDSLDKAKYQKK